MEAIVLAGGFGTRLREVVQDVPKPMAPVNGRPFLEILLTSLASKGFQRVVLSLGYMADTVVDYFGKSHDGMELVYEIEEQPLGTGGAVRSALTHCKTDHVFIFNGDTYLDLEISEVEDHWHKFQLPIIVACEVSDTTRYGRLNTADGCVTGFSEKGISGKGFINAGCYVLPTGLLDEFPLGNNFSLEENFLVGAVKERQFRAYQTHGLFIDIGIPEDYARVQMLFTGEKH